MTKQIEIRHDIVNLNNKSEITRILIYSVVLINNFGSVKPMEHDPERIV
jgi:hypothetical protein